MVTQKHKIFLATVFFTSLLVGLNLGAILGTNSAYAAPGHHRANPAPSTYQMPVYPRYQFVQAAQISPAKAKSIVRKLIPGAEVLDIARRGGVYRVRVIAPNGHVIDVYIDAVTGQVKR